MTITITLTKTGIDSNADAASSANLLLLANSMETVLNNFANGLQASDQHLFTSAQTLEIAGGIIDAPTQKLVFVSSEIGTTDNLDTIGVSNNRGIVLKAAPGETITIRSGVGNITTQDGSNLILNGNQSVEAWCMGSQWSIPSPGSQGIAVLNNYVAGSDPVGTDDSGDGYVAGSLWITALGRAFIMTDPSTNRALWGRINKPRNEWSIRAGTATAYGIGVADPTPVNAPVVANDSSNAYISYPSTAVSGNLAGWISPVFSLVRPALDFNMEWTVKTGNEASWAAQVRVWIGMIDAALTAVDTLAAGREFIGWRFSSVAGDTGWRPVLHDGTTQNTGTAIGTVVANTAYKLKTRIDSFSGIAYFSADDGQEASYSTNFPLSSQDLGPVFRVIPTSASIRSMLFSNLRVWWG